MNAGASSRMRRYLRTSRNTTGSTDRKSTRLNSSHSQISYAVFCLKKKKKRIIHVSYHPADTPATTNIVFTLTSMKLTYSHPRLETDAAIVCNILSRHKILLTDCV